MTTILSIALAAVSLLALRYRSQRNRLARAVNVLAAPKDGAA